MTAHLKSWLRMLVWRVMRVRELLVDAVAPRHYMFERLHKHLPTQAKDQRPATKMSNAC